MRTYPIVKAYANGNKTFGIRRPDGGERRAYIDLSSPSLIGRRVHDFYGWGPKKRITRSLDAKECAGRKRQKTKLDAECERRDAWFALQQIEAAAKGRWNSPLLKGCAPL